MHSCRALQHPHRRRAGFSLLEVLCGVVVLSLAALGLSRTMVASTQLAESNRERALAIEAARRVVEELQDATFSNVFALYDGGAPPGGVFDVEGLEPTLDDADGSVGQIVFPVEGTQLREDVDLPQLGMPHDLDGDGDEDALDHAADYQLLPVLVRVAWRSEAGPMLVEIRTILAQR